MKNIAVFCGSKLGNDPALVSATRQFANSLVQQQLQLVYGGAQSGLMGVLADSVLQSGGEVIGVMPTQLEGKERKHPHLTRLIDVQSMAERKQTMLQLADGFVALPGGTGTLDELFEVFTLSQIGEHHKPCALLNIQGYFDPLLAWLKHSRELGFLHSDYFDMLLVEQDPQLLLQRMHSFKHPHD